MRSSDPRIDTILSEAVAGPVVLWQPVKRSVDIDSAQAALYNFPFNLYYDFQWQRQSRRRAAIAVSYYISHTFLQLLEDGQIVYSMEILYNGGQIVIWRSC